MAVYTFLRPARAIGSKDSRRSRHSADASLVSYFNMRKTLAVLLSFIALCAFDAMAQQAPAAADSGPRFDVLSVGLRTGYRFLDPLGDRDATVNLPAADPPQMISISSESATKQVPVGPTVHLQFTDRWALTLDALYSRAGYDAVSTTETLPEGEEDPDFISELHERTRANFWDFPLLARYYLTGFREDPSRLYATGGVALRTVSGVSTFSELFIDEDGELSDTDRTPIEPSSAAVAGAVFGAGLRLQDEVGLKMDLEVRYTRWLQRAFDSNVARSSPNEGAVFVSFSF